MQQGDTTMLGNGNARIRDERGFSLILVLVMTAVLGGLASSMLTLSTKRGNWQKLDQETQNALMVAEAGVDMAIALGNDGQFGALAEGASTTLAQSTLNGGTLDIQVFRLADAVVGGTTTRTLRVESTGVYGASTRLVVGFLRQVEQLTDLTGNLPTVETAIMLADPLADITLNGNAFQISGYDKNIDGSVGPEAPVYAMGIGPYSDGTEGSVTNLTDQIGNQQDDNIVGLGGEPSVGAVNAAQIATVVSSLAPYADMTFTNYSGTYTGSLGSYASNDPKLVYSSGNIKISGQQGGFGILLVDGNLEIAGNWDYIGLVFVNGKVTFSGGGNTKKLTGAIFIEGDVQDLVINGNIKVQYSSQAIGLVQDYLDTKSTANVDPYSFVSSAESSYN